MTVDIPKWLGFLEALLKKSGTGYFVGNKVNNNYKYILKYFNIFYINYFIL